MRSKTLLTMLLVAALGVAASTLAQKGEQPPSKPAEQGKPAAGAQAAGAAVHPEEQAIVKVIEAFEKAFNAHDAKAIAALFLPDAEIVDSEGNVSIGREEIEEVFAGIFDESPECKMETSIETLRFVGQTLAFEDGAAVIVHAPDEPAERTRYTVVHVKQGDKWLMASARDLPDELSSSDEHLKQLSWLIGEWIDESPDSLVSTTYRWADNESFIVSEYEIQLSGRPAMHGSTRIGWDPLLNKLRSWNFDSEGGFGEAVWTRVDNQWIAKVTGVTRDGKAASSTNVLTYLGKDRATFESHDRIRGDELADDVGEVIMVRRPPPPLKQ